jgi:hypothetical protein
MGYEATCSSWLDLTIISATHKKPLGVHELSELAVWGGTIKCLASARSQKANQVVMRRDNVDL